MATSKKKSTPVLTDEQADAMFLKIITQIQKQRIREKTVTLGIAIYAAIVTLIAIMSLIAHT